VDEKRLPLTDHLAELRARLFKILLAWTLTTLASWNFAEEIFRFLLQPAVAALGEGARLQAISPAEIFVTYLKCAALAGLFLSIPVFFWQIWAFVAPGLYANERRAIVPFVAISTALFAGGSVFSYYAVFPAMFQFFTSFDSDFVQSAWTMSDVFALTTHMFLAFGVAFELPVFVFFLALTGIVDAPTLWRGTPYAVLVIFIVAAIFTPPDVVSQMLMGVPMVVLYLLGVGVAYLFSDRRDRSARPTGNELAKR
jgi:sec-independent protein translocase protein TatC